MRYPEEHIEGSLGDLLITAGMMVIAGGVIMAIGSLFKKSEPELEPDPDPEITYPENPEPPKE